MQVHDDKEEFAELVKDIRAGKILVHPTDTVYGLGCNAAKARSVKRIRELKKSDKPFSVIAPSKKWVRANCKASAEALKLLPGPYTIILKLKNKKCVAGETNAWMDTLGVRIPAHWFSHVVAKAGVPFVTTSANESGEATMSSIDELEEHIKDGADAIIYDGPHKSKPSTVIDFSGGKKVTLRK